MRIAAGELKGRRIGSGKTLKQVTGHGVLRPTSSKVRESIFNIIGGRVYGSLFVDLYAGTGAVGMEAISRGADRVFFVEEDKKRAEFIEKMLKDCGCSVKAEVVRQDAADFVARAKREGLMFDIIFLDPPYFTGDLDEILTLLAEGSLLRKGCIVIAEHSSRKRLPEEAGRLRQKKTYKYGDTMLTLFTVI